MKLKTLALCPLAAIGLSSLAVAGPMEPAPPMSTSLDSPEPISLSSGSWVPMLEAGTRELTVQGNFDLEGGSDFQWNLAIGYGYFLTDGWEIGINGNFSDRGSLESYGAAVFTEYNFNRQSRWVPYIGASVGWQQSDYDGTLRVIEDDGEIIGLERIDGKEDAVTVTAYLGLKYFISRNIAIAGQLQGTWAGEDLFGDGSDVDDFDDWRTSFVIGMRFYF